MLQTEFQVVSTSAYWHSRRQRSENIATSVKSADQLTKDEIYGLILLWYPLDGFVHEIKLSPDLVAILSLPDIPVFFFLPETVFS